MGGCSVQNCKNRSKKGLRVFKVPTNPERRKLWLALCKRIDCPDSAQICEVHFDESQFELHRRDGWKKLKHNAVPTIFNPNAKGLQIRKNTYSENKDEDGFFVKTTQKRCLICYEHVNEAYNTVSDQDRVCSEFGRILLLILKPSEAKILSKYCCLQCSENVLNCFTLLAELNLSTLLTYQQKSTNLQQCPVCGQIYQTREELNQHFFNHILNRDANKIQIETPTIAKNEEPLILTNADDDVSLVKKEHSYYKDREWKRRECSLVCHFCGKSYKNRNNMTRHLKAHGSHRKFSNAIQQDYFICDRCGRIFKERFGLINHMVLRHNDESLKLDDASCNKCEGNFKSNSQYLQNLPENHALSSELCCQCEICGKWFKHKLSLGRHIKQTHFHQNTLDCMACHRSFKTEKTLSRHILSKHYQHPEVYEKFDTVHVIEPNSEIIETITTEEIVGLMENETIVENLQTKTDDYLVLDDLLNLSSTQNVIM